jgi:smad nuclear-interacting protein 1
MENPPKSHDSSAMKHAPRGREEASHVSDHAALQALLMEADSGQEHQRPTNKRNFSDRGKKSSETVSYYGPGTETSKSFSNDHYDGRRDRRSNKQSPDDSYRATDTQEQPAKKLKPDFGRSMALITGKGGTDESQKQPTVLYKGVALKFSEPADACTPAKTQWRLYVFRKKESTTQAKRDSSTDSDEPLEILHVAKQSAYLIGRNDVVADIVLAHESCSFQHAVLQYRAVPSEDDRVVCRPYLLDLESTNGTFLNNVRIDAARYYQLRKGDVLSFGASSREYVLLHA